MILAGKNALITGAGRGIGRGLALEFARQGAAVIVVDLGCAIDGQGHDNSPADEVVEAIRANGGSAFALVNDVADPASVREMVATANAHVGQIDILVNNAGIMRPHWSWELAKDDYLAVLGVHLLGSFYCLAEVLPGMIERNYGRIVNMASQGYLGHPLQISYSSAKSGIVGLTYATAMEMDLIGADVTVNAYTPHALTRFGTRAQDMSREELDAVPILDAPFIAFLASDTARGVNGHVFGRSSNGEFGLYRTRLEGLFDGLGTGDIMTSDSDWTPQRVAAAAKSSGLAGSSVWPEWLNKEQAGRYVEQRTGSPPPLVGN